MIEIVLTAVNFQILTGQNENGPLKVMRLTDPQSGIAVVVPLEENASQQLAAGLTGIHVARTVPPINGVHP